MGHQSDSRIDMSQNVVTPATPCKFPLILSIIIDLMFSSGVRLKGLRHMVTFKHPHEPSPWQPESSCIPNKLALQDSNRTDLQPK